MFSGWTDSLLVGFQTINQILTALQGAQSLSFNELFDTQRSRHEVIVTFLAMLELVRLRLVHLLQSQRFGAIWLTYLLGREFFKNDILALAGAWLTAVMPTRRLSRLQSLTIVWPNTSW